MKRIISLLFGVVLFACQPSGPAVLKGKVDMGEQSKIQLFVRGAKTDTIQINGENGEFSHVFELDSPQMVRLSGIVGEGNQRFPIEQVLYLEPGENYHLHMILQERKVAMTIEEKGIENKALIDYNAQYVSKIRELWASNPSVETFQDSLFQIYSEGMELISNRILTQVVKKYLEIKAYLSYYNDYEGFVYQFARKQQQIPVLKQIQLPACFEVLDHPMALGFYNLCRCIYQQLAEKTKEPEEQMRLLQEWFKTPEIHRAMKLYICQLFVERTPYCEENYERLKKLSADLPSQEELLKAYQNKRFAILGAPYPDVVFEDPAGIQHRLSEFKGKYVYIDLWASWCGPCCAEVPFLQKLEKELKNPNVVFVSISLDAKRDAWLKKLEQLNMHGNQWHSANGDIAKMLNVKGIPHFLLYDKEGNLMQYKAARPSSGEPLKKMLSGLK